MTNPPTDPNDCAFPATLGADGYGLTKREYFAGLAMQGLRSAVLSDAITETEMWRKLWSSVGIAKQAISDADALIMELNK